MCTDKVDLFACEGLIATSELPLRKRDFIEVLKAIRSGCVTLFYTITVACYVNDTVIVNSSDTEIVYH